MPLLRRAAVVAASALILVPAAAGATTPSAVNPPHLTKAGATRLFLSYGKVDDWVGRYPRDKSFVTEATFDSTFRDWTIKVWWGAAGEIATGRVDDLTGVVTEAWTGPQVAWTMARGQKGAFGGKEINNTWVWLAFCAVFLLGLAELRRPLSLGNLDLLVLLSFTASLWFFNEGRIFTSVPLVYPPLLYLLGRMTWAGWRGRTSASRPVWPVWVLAAATVFLAGFRIGLNVRDSNVIDVGYSGVIGAQRIANGEAPYGHMPLGDGHGLKTCAPPDRDGNKSYFIQANGRCEGQDEHGDTYGPVSYLAY